MYIFCKKIFLNLQIKLIILLYYKLIFSLFYYNNNLYLNNEK